MKQQEWVLTRKKLLRRLKAQVRDRLGEPPTALRQYAKKLDHEFRGRWRSCQSTDLLKTVAESDVVLGSDFHAFAQSQRAHVRILRSLRESRSVVLAMECLCDEDSNAIAQFLKDEISEEEFLKAVDWNRNWGFPWAHYRPLFELARERRFQLIGLSRRADVRANVSLSKRDERMATDLTQLLKDHPDSLIYALVGEMHLANAHLPDALEHLADRTNAVVIFQDAEPLYFQLAVKAKDTTVEVLRSGRKFCLMVSPPWVKWQSYLMYLEQTYDRELGDVESDKESAASHEETATAIDYSDQVRSLVLLLAHDFQLPVDTSHLQVYTTEAREPLKQLKRQLPRKHWPVLLYHLTSDRSFLLPQKGLVYLSAPTLNRAATLAGQFLHSQMSGTMAPLWDGIRNFEAQIWLEAVGFFFSKWVNPKRKPESIDNMKRQLSILSPRDHGRHALLLALDQRMSEVIWMKTGRDRHLRATTRKIPDLLEAAHMLGSVLGDRLFATVRSESVTRDELLAWLRFSVTDPEFADFYRRVIKRLK